MRAPAVIMRPRPLWCPRKFVFARPGGVYATPAVAAPGSSYLRARGGLCEPGRCGAPGSSYLRAPAVIMRPRPLWCPRKFVFARPGGVYATPAVAAPGSSYLRARAVIMRPRPLWCRGTGSAEYRTGYRTEY